MSESLDVAPDLTEKVVNPLFNNKMLITAAIIVCILIIIFLIVFRKKFLKINEVENKIKKPNEFNNDLSTDLIVILTSEGCMWCKKLRDDIALKIDKDYINRIIVLESNFDGSVTIENINNKTISDVEKYLLKKYYDEHKEYIKGFPTLISNEKVLTGYIQDPDVFNNFFKIK